MQENIESNSFNNQERQQNNFFFPEILSLQQQRQRLRCPNHNQAISVCISSECSIPGLMCLESKCQCRRIHLKCHHILLDRVLESIQKHQKQIPAKVKETYKTIYDMLNQMIQKLSKLRTKFQREQMYFGLREEQLQFIDLINQPKIDQINGKVISSLEKTFDIEIELNKNTKEEIIKDFESKRKQFDKLCNNIQESYLQTRNIAKDLLTEKLFDDSKIIKQRQQKQLLNKWLKQSFENKQIKSKLLFRASQNNYSVKKFHQVCDGKNDTFVIVKNQFDKVIGGFSSIAWHSNNKEQFDKTDRSFMFSLNLKQKYKYINKSYRAIYCYADSGPTFGSGCDLRILDQCNQKNNSYGNFGCSYNILTNHKNKYSSGQQQIYTLFTGSPKGSNFKIKER